MTTCQRRELVGTEWENNLQPARPGTSIRYYGNMEVETVEHIAHIGDYTASIVPDSCRAALISTNDFITHSHTVCYLVQFLHHHRRHPRMPDTKEWRVALRLLQRLSDLRAKFPLPPPLPLSVRMTPG